MKTQICQSCAMPLKSNYDHGTNQDGSLNKDYCRHCFHNGKFTNDISIDEMIEVVTPYLSNAISGLSGDMAKKQLQKLLPTLKRWKEN